MDIHRTRLHPQQQPKAIDGFFSKPSMTARPAAASRRGGLAHARPGARPEPTGRTETRGLTNFGRPDGFYSAPRRTAAPTGQVAKPAATKPATSSARTAAPAPQLRAASATIGDDKANKTKRSTRRQDRRARARPQRSSFQIFRRRAFRFVAVCLILMIALGGVLAGKGYLKFKKIFSGSSTAAALQVNVDPTKLKGEGDGRVNIMLLGVGGADHDGGDLTDTIMIASIDPVNNQAVLFSIPRDLWVKMPNNYIANYQKINAAYESGKYKYLGKQNFSNADKKAVTAGFDAVDSTIERVAGVPIHYNVLVDFQAFRQAIDTVGGVSITAAEPLVDPTMAWENGWSSTLAKAGVNNFDGKHALNYVRSRETSSDFARSQRQRAVLVALKDKVLNLGTLSNPVKLSKLMNDFGDNVQTDISVSDTTRLAGIMKKISNNSIQSVGLADEPNSFVTTGSINGLSVVEPKAGLEDYSQIQSFVRSKLKDGYLAQENAKIEVLNATVTPGLATTKADELKSYGYNVVKVDNAPATDCQNTSIIDLSKGSKKYTVNYLKNRYHVQTVATQLPTGVLQNGADVVIMLCQDATITTQN